VKSVVFGSRRSARAGGERTDPLDAALAPALVEGRWRVPGRFNFTRDVVEARAQDSQRVALTAIGRDGVIEPRTFLQLAQGAARWSALLDTHDVRPGDRVLVVAQVGPEWVEVVLAALKVGAIAVPCAETLPADALDVRISATQARLVVASRDAEAELARTASQPDVLPLDETRRQAHRLPKEAPTHDTSARDPALIVTTSGRASGPRGVLHAQAAIFAARMPAEHWLEVGEGDVLWCTASSDSGHVLWSLFGPWARGAEVVLHEGPLDPVERLELMHRLGVTVLCQRPAEYRALAETGHLARFRSARPRRIVSTGDYLGEDLIAQYEEQWGLTIHDGYGLAESGIVAGSTTASGYRAGSIGKPLPGYVLAVVDDEARPLPPGQEGELALGGRPPSLFAGYWNAPDATKAAFRGDWYLTGDVAAVDADGYFWLLEGALRPRPVPVRETRPAPVEARAPAPVATRPAAAPAARPEPRTDAPVPQPVPVAVSQASEPHDEPEPIRRAAPLWARATAIVWLLLLGVLVGGAAIPHADDEPRVVPRAEDAPNSICLPPKLRR
jgi:acyl-coenzyme A synthetase/AMP-(fatty) acid ligase